MVARSKNTLAGGYKTTKSFKLAILSTPEYPFSLYEPEHEKMACAPSEDSDQPGHPGPV